MYVLESTVCFRSCEFSVLISETINLTAYKRGRLVAFGRNFMVLLSTSQSSNSASQKLNHLFNRWRTIHSTMCTKILCPVLNWPLPSETGTNVESRRTNLTPEEMGTFQPISDSLALKWNSEVFWCKYYLVLTLQLCSCNISLVLETQTVLTACRKPRSQLQWIGWDDDWVPVVFIHAVMLQLLSKDEGKTILETVEVKLLVSVEELWLMNLDHHCRHSQDLHRLCTSLLIPLTGKTFK